MGGEEDESNVDQAVVRAGYRSLMEDITNNEEELGDVSGVCHTQLKEYMEASEALFQQVKIYLKTGTTSWLFYLAIFHLSGVSSPRGSARRSSAEATFETVRETGGANVRQHHAVQPAGFPGNHLL